MSSTPDFSGGSYETGDENVLPKTRLDKQIWYIHISYKERDRHGTIDRDIFVKPEYVQLHDYKIIKAKFRAQIKLYDRNGIINITLIIYYSHLLSSSQGFLNKKIILIS